MEKSHSLKFVSIYTALKSSSTVTQIINLIHYIFLFYLLPSPGQQDPTQESREVQEGILSMLDRGAEVSIRILEQLLGAGEVKKTKSLDH